MHTKNKSNNKCKQPDKTVNIPSQHTVCWRSEQRDVSDVPWALMKTRGSERMWTLFASSCSCSKGFGHSPYWQGTASHKPPGLWFCQLFSEPAARETTKSSITHKRSRPKANLPWEDSIFISVHRHIHNFRSFILPKANQTSLLPFGIDVFVGAKTWQITLHYTLGLGFYACRRLSEME